MINLYNTPFVLPPRLFFLSFLWSMLFVFRASISLSCHTPQDTTRKLPTAIVMERGVRYSEEAIPMILSDTTTWRRGAAVTLSDILLQMPGIQLRDYGGKGALKTVGVYGADATHTVIVDDGWPVADAQSGQIDLSTFSLERFSQISLTVGGNPDLLCPVRSIATAVLHFSTATDLQEFYCGGGSYGDFNAGGRTGWKSSIGRFHAAADYWQADNNYPFTLINGCQQSREIRHHNAAQNLHLQAGWQYISDTARTSRLEILHQAVHRQLPGPVLLYTTRTGEQMGDSNTQLRYLFRRKALAWQFLLLAQQQWHNTNHTDVDLQYPSGEQKEHYRQSETYLSAGALCHPNTSLSAAYTIDLIRPSLHTDAPIAQTVSRWEWHQALSLRYQSFWGTITARLLRHDIHHVASTIKDFAQLPPWQKPGAARNEHRCSGAINWSRLVYRRPTFACHMKGYAQQQFRLPTFTENYFFRFGNTLLRPERSLLFGAECIAEGKLSVHPYIRFRGTTGAYRHLIDDHIIATPITPAAWHAENVDRVNTWGMNLSTSWLCVVPTVGTFTLSTHLSYQYSVDRSDKRSATYGHTLPYHPVYDAHLALSWEKAHFGFSASAVAGGKCWTTPQHAPHTEIPAYLVCHFSMFGYWSIGKIRCRLSATVNNLADYSRESIRGYPLPGRTWHINSQFVF